MPAVTNLCDNNATQTWSLIGVEAVSLFAAAIVELASFLYFLYQVFYIIPHKRKNHVSKSLKMILLFYHIFVCSYFSLNLGRMVYTSIHHTDQSPLFACYIDILGLMPAGIYYVLFVLFWHLRLKLVFNHSQHRVTKFENNFLLSFLALSIFFGFGSVVYASIESILANDKNDVFCLSKLTGIDFYPYIGYSWTHDFPQPFYDCDPTSDSVFIAIMVAAVTVPLMNIFMAIQYIRKMYLLFHRLAIYKDINNNNNNNNSNTNNSTHVNVDTVSPTASNMELQTITDNTTNNKNNDNDKDTNNQKSSNVSEKKTENWQNNNEKNVSENLENIQKNKNKNNTRHNEQNSQSTSINKQNNNNNNNNSNNNSSPLSDCNNSDNNELPKLTSQRSWSNAAANALGARRESLRILTESQKQHIYRNGIIAIFSAFSTLLSLVLFTIEDDFVIFIYFDAVLNGILMMSAFEFGAWLYELLCIKICKNCCFYYCCYCCCYRWMRHNNEKDSDINSCCCKICDLVVKKDVESEYEAN